jgi:hypothetical protein
MLGRNGLVDWDAVGVAVGDPPLALLAAKIEVSHRVWGTTGDARTELAMWSEADQVRQVATDAGGDQVEALVGALGPPRRQPRPSPSEPL